MPSELRGLKVLVVEDNYLVAELVRSLFEECGSETVGPAARVDSALALIDEGGDLDGAVLDINLAGTEVYPAAEVLRSKGTPIIFVTGYGRRGVLNAWHECPILQKPFSLRDLEQAIARVRRPSA